MSEDTNTQDPAENQDPDGGEQQPPAGDSTAPEVKPEAKGKTAPAPKAQAKTPAPKAKTPDPEPEPVAEEDPFEVVPESKGNTSEKAQELLFQACEAYGVNPNGLQRPRELAAWSFYPGSRIEGVPDAVVFVTSGGLKVKHWADPNHPMDGDTEDRLRNAFGAWAIVNKERVPAPLPADRTLPEPAVTGIPSGGSRRHVYPGGYLRRKK